MAPFRSRPHPALDAATLAAAEVAVRRPERQTAPLVFASPHSGRSYPAAFRRQTRLDARRLRKSEDAFIDALMGNAPALGAPLIAARFPRAYVDANREAWELDPAMFDAPLPDHVTTRSPRLAAGLGTIPRIVANGEEIYAGPLDFAEARRRIERHHTPYHAALTALVEDTVVAFGCCVVVDCHSMPSAGAAGGDGRRLDVVLGDCHGSACAVEVTDAAERALALAGLVVVRNRPYAGGYTTRHWGRPYVGLHALQVEINRALYMDEARFSRGLGYADLRRRLGELIAALATVDPAVLRPRAAAE